MTDTQAPAPKWIAEFDSTFHVDQKTGQWSYDNEGRHYCPTPYDVKECIAREMVRVGREIQEQVERFIVDQRNHEVSPEHIVDSIIPLIQHIRRTI